MGGGARCVTMDGTAGTLQSSATNSASQRMVSGCILKLCRQVIYLSFKLSITFAVSVICEHLRQKWISRMSQTLCKDLSQRSILNFPCPSLILMTCHFFI